MVFCILDMMVGGTKTMQTETEEPQTLRIQEMVVVVHGNGQIQEIRLIL